MEGILRQLLNRTEWDATYPMKTILLIDDDEGIRSIFGLALRSRGYRVIEADSGSTGFEVATQQLPDLILSDISMPSGDGQALLKKIREHPELSTKQVVLMTGRADLVTPRKGMESGADDFLVKPVGLDDLLRCVEARLNRATVHWRMEDQMLTQLRSTLRSTLPHEFFTPLAGIIGLTGILQADFKTFSPDEVQDLLDDLHLSALRLHRTLKNYLMILDFQGVKQENKPKPAPLATGGIEDSIRSGVSAALSRHKRLPDVSVQIEEGSIAIKAQDLGLIVEELLDNACNFSPSGTPITVKFGSDTALTITDAGRGMTPEEIRRIGLFQQHNRKKNEQQGLGLGLTLVQKLLAEYEATLSFESAPGKGTKARVAFLPA